MFRLLAITGFIISLCIMPPALAQGKSRSGQDKETVAEKAFSRETVSIIADVLGMGHEEIYPDETRGKGRGKGLPPGLATRSQLPPGLAKMRSLPPGLAKSGLPYSLDSLLPPPPPGTGRYIIDDTSVVLVELATGKVIDIEREQTSTLHVFEQTAVAIELPADVIADILEIRLLVFW